MEPVEPLLAAVRPFIQEAIRASGVTGMINTSSNTAAALRDNKVIWCRNSVRGNLCPSEPESFHTLA